MPLQVTTTALCEAEVVSITLVYPVINGLLKKHLSAKPDDLAPIKAFKEIVSQQIKCRFIPDSLEIVDKPPFLAAVDPHYHQLKFVSERQQPLVYAALKEKVDEIATDQDVIECESSSATETIQEKTKDTALSFS